MNRLIVISPHLDDAVFSCGSFIASAALVVPVVVATVFAGVPPEGSTKASNLERAAGFKTAQEAASTRRREDAKAVRVLGATHLHMNLLGDDHSRSVSPEERRREVEDAIHYILGVDGIVLGPWGIRHPDHILVADVLADRASYRYEELPYRVLWSEYLPHDLPPPVLELPSTALKQAAIRCYKSQLGGDAGEALAAAERYHRA